MPHRAPLKLGALVLIIVAASVVLGAASTWVNETPVGSPTYGITFSTLYAEQLGLHYQEAYTALVEELGVRQVRIPIYWSEIEHEQGVYDWTAMDWMVAFSESHEVTLTPVVGVKVPRWPECFVPDWAETFTDQYLHQEALVFIEQAVNRYKDSEAVERFQVENEPVYPYGICPELTHEQFQERVDLVRSLSDQPIQVTVSGEVGPWLDAAQAADVLGLSLYRQTWNDAFGYFVYPLSPEYYYLRISLIDPSVEQVIISELQAEPWFPEPIESQEFIDWYKNFTVEDFARNIAFVEETGVGEAYLWGAEWWYVLSQHGDPRLWDFALKLFN